MIPREANLSEAPAKYHLVKPKNPPKDNGFQGPRINYHQVFILSLCFYVVSMRLSKEREDFCADLPFHSRNSDLKLHVTRNKYVESRV